MRSLLHAAFAVIVLAVAAAMVWVLWLSQPKAAEHQRQETPLQVTVQPATREDLPVRVRAQGNLRPVRLTPLAVEVGGRVVWRNEALRRGADVAAGEELLRIDPADYQTRLTQAREQLARAELAVQQEQAQVAQAAADWQALGREGTPAHPLASRQAHLRAAIAAREAAAAGVAQAERDVARCHLRAPYAGSIVSESVEVGALVNPGQQVGELVDTGAGEIHLPLTDQQARLLGWRPGGPLPEPAPTVVVAPIDQPAATRPARWVRRSVSRDPATRMIDAILLVERPLDPAAGPPLAFHTFCRVELTGAPLTDVIRIPPRAIYDDDRIAVLEGDALRFLQVDIVHRDADRVLIRSPELDETSRIVTTPVDRDQRDRSVTVIDDQASAAAEDGASPDAAGASPAAAVDDQAGATDDGASPDTPAADAPPAEAGP